MILRLRALWSVAVIALATAVCAADPFAAEIRLATAVERFNARAKLDAVGKAESPLTAEEVVAAIRGWVRKQHPVPDAFYNAFQTVANTQTLPAGSRLDFTTGWQKNNGHDFVVWWVDLTLSDPAAPGSDPATTAAFTYRIRDRKISLRPATKAPNPRKVETRVSAPSP